MDWVWLRNCAGEELSHTTIPKQVWPEILGMSLEGRKAIVDYLEQQVSA